MSVVTVVARAGLGAGEYRVLREGDEHQTSGQIDHYSHIMVVDEYNVDAAVGQLEERYGHEFTEVTDE